MKKILILLMTMIYSAADAQINMNYQQPHADIMALADVDPAPAIRMTTDGELAVLMYRKNYKSIDELAQEELRLAGLRINPVTNINSRATYYHKLEILSTATGKIQTVAGLPEAAKLTNFTWSEDQSKLAMTHTSNSAVTIWILDLKTAAASELSSTIINANMGADISWIDDDQAILVKVLPAKRPILNDKSSMIPAGPTISENDGQLAQNRTYQDLLKNPIDEANFEILATSEIKKIGLDGSVSDWLSAGMYSDISLSPDGSYVMVTEVKKPFSYIVPYSRFPNSVTIYDSKGKAVKLIAETPLIEEMPKGFMATYKGPRNFSWRADQPNTVVWCEALDQGDPEIEMEFRDAVYQLSAPFIANPQELLKTNLRYSGITWGDDDLALISEYWWNTRTVKQSFFNPSDPSADKKLFTERNYQDNYSDPGTFVTKRNKYGWRVLEEIDGALFLLGDGYSAEGKHPFVDKYEVASGLTTRLFHNKDESMLEDISTAIDMKEGKLLVRREAKDKFPNYYFRNIYSGKLDQITSIDNPFKAIQDVHKEVITYKRSDGLELSATLYLPVGYDMNKKEKMPMLMWAYPREYKDKNSASQVTSSANEFTYPYYGSPVYWVNRGYVVLEDVAFPIIGEGEEEPNDSFREQLVDNAKSAIDAVDNLGFIDRNRVGVGGHSYGAFMTANLLSHSNLFAAGIARSGAYNRTLTPFGFQSEERSYWDAPEVYYTMSPFMHADKMKTPLLLVHGEADNNSGTYPMQSERYFNALKGLGATVRLVMLPLESHGYAARESIMHMLWEQDQWLERYVKNKYEETKP